MKKIFLILAIACGGVALDSFSMADPNSALIDQAANIVKRYQAASQFANLNVNQDTRALINLRNNATTYVAKRVISSYLHELMARTDGLDPSLPPAPACLKYKYRDAIPK